MSWLSGSDRNRNMMLWFLMNPQRPTTPRTPTVTAPPPPPPPPPPPAPPTPYTPAPLAAAPVVPAPPMPDNPAVKAAVQAANAETDMARRKGRLSTFLTGALGDSSFGSSVSRPTLLGRA